MIQNLRYAGALACLFGALAACSGNVSQDTGESPPVTPPDSSAPAISFRAASSTVANGGSTTLSWSATNADACTASDGWSGSRPTSGSESTGALTATRSYRLACSGPAGGASAIVTVNVATGESPSLSLDASDTVVDSGGTTTLVWSSTNATSCTASGAWSGNRATSGSETVGPITSARSYTLTCTSSAGASAIATESVAVNGTLALSWIAPTENVDGTPLTDLGGYRVYYGQTSRSYPYSADVGDPTATTVALTVPSGSYYVAMTAFDGQGNESTYSNEVLKRVP